MGTRHINIPAAMVNTLTCLPYNNIVCMNIPHYYKQCPPYISSWHVINSPWLYCPHKIYFHSSTVSMAVQKPNLNWGFITTSITLLLFCLSPFTFRLRLCVFKPNWHWFHREVGALPITQLFPHYLTVNYSFMNRLVWLASINKAFHNHHHNQHHPWHSLMI